MNLSIRKFSLATGFYAISIFGSSFSMLLGGDSIRAGLVLSVVIFFSLVTPFGVRYFITPKIILINITILFLILFFYAFSALIFPGTDVIRFFMSLILIFLLSLASLVFVATMDSLGDKFFKKMIIFGFYFLICLGYIVLALMIFSGREAKNMFLFTEPSHYAIVLIPFLFFIVLTSDNKLYGLLYIISAIVLSLTIKSLTLLVGSLFIIILIYSRHFWHLLFFVSLFLIASFLLDLDYFSARLDISANNQNLSTLVFLSGWERAYLSFVDSYGFGVGFQQMGIVGPEGELQIAMRDILGGVALNVNDGGSLGSKLVTDLGFLGVVSLMYYVFFAFKIAKKFLLEDVNGFKNIFFLGIYLLFSIELFVRGMGYFSLTSFLFISSIYWIYRSQIFRH